MLKVIVIGGVAAGMSAASKIKRESPQTQVTVYEKGEFLSYGACGLPYYVGDFNDDYRKMIARPIDHFTKMGIDIFNHHEVLSIDTINKTATIKNHKQNTTLTDSYDKLIISTGASSVVPNWPGKDLLGVQTLKTLEDGIFVREFAKSSEVKNVVIVGGGYIGIECCEAFLNLGKNVRLVEAGDRILSTFDEEYSTAALDELVKHGLNVNLNEKVQAFAGDLNVKYIKTDKNEYAADLVIVAVGVRPSTNFITDKNIEKTNYGAIVVNRKMETTAEDVYSAGDCAVSYNRVLDDNIFLTLGTVANKCGRIMGENILGANKEFVGSLATSAIKVCNLEFVSTGVTHHQAKALGLNYKTVSVTAMDHPAYYPDPTPLSLKLVYEKDTKQILGAQIHGNKNAVLRGDIFAVAIHNKMTTYELGQVDLAYAPPFAGVWDAVHIACNAAK